MDKQDKTAKEYIIEIYGENWTDTYFKWDAPDVIDIMESYVQPFKDRTAELEAKIKELEEDVKDSDQAIDDNYETANRKVLALEAKIKELESELHSEIHDNGILHKKVEALEEQLKEVPNRKRAVISEVVELRAKVKSLEERLQTADEYIVVVTNDVKGFDCASHVINKMNEVLGKYQSLKK